MVRDLHAAGIEVILDVVYNHTAEGNHLGPTLSFRGIDNAAYYRLVDDDQSLLHGLHRHRQHACNMRSPHVLQLIMDSLRYWVTEMHVDGFRFDLAASAGARVPRGRPAVRVLRPRPAGSGRLAGQADRRAVGRRRRRLPGRQLPAAVDRVERQVPRHRARLLARRAGSLRRVRDRAHRVVRPLRERRARARSPASTSSPRTTASRCATWSPTTTSTTRPTARTTTTASSHNRSWNCGVEGPTDDPAILALRARQQRNLLATLLLSQGVPMLLHGDELGRTQHGNNNAYCQDNEISWIDWDARRRGPARRSPRAARATCAREHPVFRRRRFFTGPTIRAARRRLPTSPGSPPTARRWATRTGRAGRRPLAVFLNGHGIARAPTCAASRSSTTRSCPASTPHRRGPRRLRRCPRRATAPAWADRRSTPATGRRRDAASGERRDRSDVQMPERRSLGASLRRHDVTAARVLRATYRLQLHAGIRLRRGAAIVPYLQRLGVGHVYLSPVLQAAPGSQHGYDVVDHGRVDAELGGATGLAALAEAAHAHGLGIVLDIVPNHMAIPVPEHLNRPAVVGLLRRAATRRPRDWFDVDWDRRAAACGLPVLGQPASTSADRRGSMLTVGGHDGEAVRPVLRPRASRCAPGSDARGGARRRCSPPSTTRWPPGARPTTS